MSALYGIFADEDDDDDDIALVHTHCDYALVQLPIRTGTSNT